MRITEEWAREQTLARQCCICHEHSSICWMTPDPVEVCDRCCRQILPRIIADAVQLDLPDDDERVLRDVQLYYFRALAKRRAVAASRDRPAA